MIFSPSWKELVLAFLSQLVTVIATTANWLETRTSKNKLLFSWMSHRIRTLFLPKAVICLIITYTTASINSTTFETAKNQTDFNLKYNGHDPTKIINLSIIHKMHLFFKCIMNWNIFICWSHGTSKFKLWQNCWIFK